MSARSPWMSELEAYQEDLRAKVEALPSPMDDGDHISRWVLRADVLALIDGSSQ